MSISVRMLIALVGLGLVTAPAAGQVVRGELVDGETGAGVPGAVVVLLGAGDRAAASTLTDSRGRFVLQPPGEGSFRLRAERIGYAETLSPRFAVRAGEVVERRLVASAERIALEGLVVQGRARCTIHPASGEATARVWEEARKGLRAAETAQSQRLFRYGIQRFDRLQDPGSGRVVRESSRSSLAYVEQPFESVPVQRLASAGYITADGDTTVYHAPSAAVLLSDEFLDGHCFRLEADPGDPSRIGLAFEPVRGRRVPDIEGVLWLDRESAELRSLDFRYTRAPVQGARGVPGGWMEFRRLPNGVTYVHRWGIRMPSRVRFQQPSGIPGAERPPELLTREVGGEIASVSTASGAPVSAETGAVLTGVVYDSTQPGPLVGARVFLSGTSHVATVDSTGRYTLRGLRPGTYALGLLSPRLESIRYTPPPVSVTLERDATETRDLVVPSWASLLTRSCAEAAGASASAVAGFARDARTGAPAAGVPVTLSWRQGGATRTAETRTDSLGAYRLCGVPAGVDLLLAAAGARETVRAEPGLPRQQDLAVTLSPAAPTRVAAGAAESRSAGRSPAGRDAITREEIERAGTSDALALVRRYHPEWLRRRGGGGTLRTQEIQGLDGLPQQVMVQTEIAAYRDQVRLPRGVDDLGGIPSEQIERIEFLDAMDATTRFGTDHPHGAIVVSTRGG